MKNSRSQDGRPKGRNTLIGWRASRALKARFEAFLAQQPPIDKPQWLEVALIFYLDHAERGYNPQSLRPTTSAKKGRKG